MLEINNDNTILLSGTLDEFTNAESFIDLLKSMAAKLSEKQGGGPAKISFKEAPMLNSIAIKKFLLALRECETSLNMIECPVWLVDQFNIITGFFGDTHFVSSFFAPYYNEEEDLEQFILVDIAERFDLQKSFTSQDFSNETIDGVEYTPDFSSKNYLQFLMPIEQRIRDHIEKDD